MAASQMAWQDSDEIEKRRELFAKVTGRPVGLPTWLVGLTLTQAVLLGLAAEQGLKALVIADRSQGKRPHGHDLWKLWKALPQISRDQIERNLQVVRRRVKGTRLAESTLSTAHENVLVHRHTFEHARYLLETRPTCVVGERKIETVDLWQLAIAVYLTASEAIETRER